LGALIETPRRFSGATSVGGKPLPLPVWDRDAGKLFNEFMDDHPATYDSRPRRSLTQWLESRRLYDWMIAAYQGSRWSTRNPSLFGDICVTN
jgi:hypothetical protein